LKGWICLSYFDLFKKELIKFHRFSKDEIPKPEITFKEVLLREEPETYNDLLFIADIFDPFPFDIFNRDPFEVRKFKEDIVLDNLLSNTRGNILFDHQLESIFQIAGNIGQDESFYLRKKWNDKDQESISKIEKMLWTNNKLLIDILKSRMVTDYTTFEPHNIAVKLIRVL